MIIQHYFIHFFYGKLKHYAEGRFMAPILILFNKTQSLKENLKERMMLRILIINLTKIGTLSIFVILICMCNIMK